jgi:ankyrin repeat protein
VHLSHKLSPRRFRWVSCQMDALERCLEQRSLEKALVSLPETLDETYSRILDSIPGENKQSAVRILQLLIYSERPLDVAEVIDAIAVDITEEPHFDPRYRMPDPDEILFYCSGLVAMVPMSVRAEHQFRYDLDSDDELMYDENSGEIYGNEQNSPRKHPGTKFSLQLAHFSVKEYLISGRFRGPLSLELHETTARESIALVCLSYLLQFESFLSRRKIITRYPFARYCAVVWLSHASLVEGESSNLTSLIQHLFCNNQAAYRLCYRLYCPEITSQYPLEGEGTRTPAPALYYAALGNLYPTVKLLLDNGANVNEKGGYRTYALIIALARGHEEIAQLLIERGANVSVFDDEYCYNALMEASFHGPTRVVELLLEHGANVNARGYNGQNALVLATASYPEHPRILRLLLDNGAYDMRNSLISSALEKASMHGHFGAVELLLERSADVYRQDTRFVDEALRLACDTEEKHIIKLLLSKGANMYTTSLVWKVFDESVRQDRQETAKTLLEVAYIVLKSNIPENYDTIVHFSASLGCTYLLRFIYENHETDLYVSEPYGKTPLHLAAGGGHMETFEYLITMGADPAVLDAKGDGILCYAAAGGHFEMVKAILNKKLGSEQYSIHWSPLHWACRAGQDAIVELLLENGLRSHLVATEELEGQWSPLDVATYAGEGQILERLPAAIRPLLSVNYIPGRYSRKSFQGFEMCYGCRLVSSHEMLPNFADIRAAILWVGFPVSHMQGLLTQQ